MGSETQAREGQHDNDPAHFRGKPPSEEESVKLLVMILEPGDEHHLAELIRNHPQFRDEIIAEATKWVGSDFVGKALAMLAGAAEHSGEPAAAGAAETPGNDTDLMTPDFDAPATERTPSDGSGDELMTPDFDAAAPTQETNTATQPALDDELMNPYAEEAAAETSAAPTQDEFAYELSPLALQGGDESEKVQLHVEFIQQNPQLREQVLKGVMDYCPHLFDPIMAGLANPEPETQPEPVSEAEVAQEPTDGEKAAEGKTESAWVTKAKEYNRCHAALVDRFNQLTLFVCMSDTETDVDPVKVSDWQQAHGLDPDGRVGPLTVAAAEKSTEEPVNFDGPVTSPDQVG